MTLFIGNTIMLVASVIMILSGVPKKKEQIIVIQTVQILLMAIGMFVLNSYVACLINIFSLIRNVLAYKNKLCGRNQVIVLIASTLVAILANNIGIIGFLPIIANALYIMFMNTKDIVKFKCILIATSVLWIIHDFYICSYTSGIMDMVCILMNCISIYSIKEKR